MAPIPCDREVQTAEICEQSKDSFAFALRDCAATPKQMKNDAVETRTASCRRPN